MKYLQGECHSNGHRVQISGDSLRREKLRNLSPLDPNESLTEGLHPSSGRTITRTTAIETHEGSTRSLAANGGQGLDCR